MSRYDRQIATAKRQIAKDGQAATWRVLTDGAPIDPLKPWKPSASVSVEHAVTIAFLPVSRQEKKSNQYKKDTEVPTGFLLGYMAAVDFAPSIKDVIIRNGVELTVLDFDEISPNGEPIFYILELGS